MKPERARDRWKSLGIARAKMFLKAHLEWLDGVPIAQSIGRVEWQTRPRVGSPCTKTIVVDRHLLHQTQTALTVLTRHFPDALPKLIDDVPSWQQNVARLLECLKSAIHQGTDVVSTQATPVDTLSKPQKRVVEQLMRSRPALAPMLQTVVWSGWVISPARDFLIPWIAHNAEWIDEFLQNSGVDYALSMILLVGDLVRVDGEECLQFLKPILADATTFHVVTSNFNETLQQFLGKLKAWKNPKSPPPQLHPTQEISYGRRIVDFLYWLSDQDHPTRRRAIHIAALVFRDPLVRSWRNAWEASISLSRRTIRSLSQFAKVMPIADFHEELQRITSAFEEKLNEHPLRFPVAEILSCVQLLAVERSAEFNESLCGLLAAVPIGLSDGLLNRDGYALRLSLVSEASRLESSKRAILYLDLSRRFFSNKLNHDFQLRPWDGLIFSWNRNSYAYWSPYNILCNEQLRLGRWPDFFAALDRLRGHPSYAYCRNDTIVWLLQVSRDVDQACDRFQQLPQGVLESCTLEKLRTADLLESNDFAFVEFLELIGSSDSVQDSQLAAIRILYSAFADAGWESLIPTLLKMKRATDVARVATQFQIAKSSGDPPSFIQFPTTTAIPEWAASLPSALHSCVGIFSTVFPDSRQRLLRILEKQFPDPHKLQSEIAAIQERARLSSPLPVNLQKRLENLSSRLHHSRCPSDVALIRMQGRLHEALMNDVFQDAGSRIEASLTGFFDRRGDSNPIASQRLPVPEELDCDRYTKTRRVHGAVPRSKPPVAAHHLLLIQEILKLDEPFRKYGMRLLRRRWGNVRWDLEQEPQNRRFLDGLLARGIRTEPWFSSRECQIAVEGQDRPWTLALESDEVEQLLMGYHFSTCLSPGDINFFSAVSNAIDINKRVLYARDWQGHVMGRCLIAIGDTGGIVVFRPYCQTNTADFPKHVAQFVSNLAADMGTVVLHNDRVSKLVAPNWYDDGTHDLGNSISSDGSPVRVAIQNASEQTLIATLDAALSPVPMNRALLELIIRLPEFETRPELVRPLLPLFNQYEGSLPMSTRVCVARLSHLAGMRDVAARLLDSKACEWIARELIRYRDFHSQAGNALILLSEYRPSAALRIVRATRTRSVRRDEDETEYLRRRLLFKCFSALGRDHLAAKMVIQTTSSSL